MSNLIHTQPLQAFVRAYNSMWIADCACKNAMPLQRLQPMFECDYCGSFYELVWPSEEMVYSIERLLLMRPLPYTRNWWPGETLYDLMVENGEHGVFSEELVNDHGPGVGLLVVDDEGIKVDKMPVTARRFKAVEA